MLTCLFRRFIPVRHSGSMHLRLSLCMEKIACGGVGSQLSSGLEGSRAAGVKKVKCSHSDEDVAALGMSNTS